MLVMYLLGHSTFVSHDSISVMLEANVLDAVGADVLDAAVAFDIS